VFPHRWEVAPETTAAPGRSCLEGSSGGRRLAEGTRRDAYGGWPTAAAMLRLRDYPVFSEGKSGGIGTHTYALANAISAVGHDVTVIAQAAGDVTTVENGVKLHGVSLRNRRLWKLGKLLPLNWLRWSIAADRALRQLHDSRAFDVLVVPDAYGEGFCFALDPILPFVVRFGGPASIVQRWDRRKVPAIRSLVERRIERLPPSRASLLVCASRPFAELISREWSLEISRFRFVRNPLDLRRFVPAPRPDPSGRRWCFRRSRATA